MLNSDSKEDHDDKNAAAMSSSLFDFIVIGAGSSGMGFLAGLLQADFVGSVAVVERGGGGADDDDDAESHDENKNNNQTAHWYRDSHHYQGNDTMLTATCWGRILRVPTGSGLGGTSRIHASLCLSPLADDFMNHHDDDNDDAWPEPCRIQLLRSLDCIQQLLEQNQALHVYHQHPVDQHNAPITCNNNNKKDDDDETFVKDNKTHKNHPRICIRSIPCRCTVTAPNGKYRINYYKGLVAPLLQQQKGEAAHHQHTQIQWFTNCTVQHLVTAKAVVKDKDGQKEEEDETGNKKVAVRGVKLWNKVTQSYQVLYAKRKVILAAGVFASPALLLASGLLSKNCTTNSNSSKSWRSSTNHTREKHRNDAGPMQKQQEQSLHNNGDDDDDKEQYECWVDLPLMDHVMIPCAMFSWRPLIFSQQQQLSWNGVQSLHQVDYYNDYNEINNNNNKQSINNNNNNKKRFLVSRMDATVHADILPCVLVDWIFRREWLLPHLYRNIPAPEDWSRRRLPRPPSLLVLGNVVQTVFAMAVYALAALLEAVVRWAILWTPLGWILRYHVILMTIFSMNPNTTGNKLSIRRRQKTQLDRSKMTAGVMMKNPPLPQVQVKIDLPYLNDEQDIVALQAVWQDCKHLVAPRDAIEFFPGSWIRRCGYFGLFRWYCRAFCLPFFHWSGTLPLGGSMVDRHFGVRHVDSLCICDASVFPRQVSVPPALTCAALGHCLACLLLQQRDDYKG